MKFGPFPRKQTPAPAPRAEGDSLDRFRRGDPRAFEELVEEFAPGIVRLFRRHGVDPASSEDLAQEVFVRLYRTQSRYESTGRLKVYLYKIARNVWLDWRRMRTQRPRARSFESPGDLVGLAPAAYLRHPAIGPAEALAGRDAARLLHELLARLAEGERLVLELALFEEMPYAEIAATLLIPEGTVKSRVHHALRKLRAWSRGQGDLVA